MVIPTEVLVVIFQWVPFRWLIHVSQVCRHWREICKETRFSLFNFPRSLTHACAELIVPKFSSFSRLVIDEAGIGDETLELFSGWNLKSLELYNCFNITNKGLAVLSLPCLEIFFLFFDNPTQGLNITDETLDILARNCPLLKKFRVSKCGNLTGEGFGRLVGNCPALEYVYLYMSPGMRTIFSKPNVIETLIIDHCITDGSFLENISQFCPRLKKLVVRAQRFFGTITEEQVVVFLQKNPNVLLNLDGHLLTLEFQLSCENFVSDW